MGVRKLKPTTPGQRFMVLNDFDALTTGNNPEKSLILKKSKSGGRNNTGKMTMRHTGGGHKRRYRVIDFKRDKFNIPAVVKTIEYDPNRTAFIALLNYADGEKRYMIAPNGLKEGQTVLSGKDIAPEVGNTLFLSEIPLGATIHNIEHHRSHIASSFFASRFDKSAILSIDGFGDFTSTMSAIGDGNKFEVLDEVNYPHSLGVFYTTVTQFLGFPNYGD